MRDRERILQNLDTLFRDAFADAQSRSDRAKMDQLDFEYQRHQLYLEVLLDLREALARISTATEPAATGGETGPGGVSSFLDTAEKLRKLTRLR